MKVKRRAVKIKYMKGPASLARTQAAMRGRAVPVPVGAYRVPRVIEKRKQFLLVSEAAALSGYSTRTILRWYRGRPGVITPPGVRSAIRIPVAMFEDDMRAWGAG